MMSNVELRSEKRWRGTGRASITKLVRHVADMECEVPLSPTDEIVAERMEQKVYEMDKDLGSITTPLLI